MQTLLIEMNAQESLRLQNEGIKDSTMQAALHR
jgi:hypothetical protein